MDEAYVKAGLKGKRGLKRPPRKRGLKSRGRVTYDSDNGSDIAAVERGSGKVRIQPQRRRRPGGEGLHRRAGATTLYLRQAFHG